MKTKRLWRVSVATSPEAEEAVIELLAATLGVTPSVYADLEKRTTTVTAFVEEQRPQPAALRRELQAGLDRIAACGLNAGPGTITLTRVPVEDWAESWKKHFKPLAIGSALMVRPGWLHPRLKPGQVEVVLDPGLSFGTGQHPTTGFCLNEVVRYRPRATRGTVGHRALPGERSFLDLGTGSGILAIAAVKLGYSPVQAIEYDPEAVEVAGRNARKNGVLKQLQLVHGDVQKLPLRPKQKHDLVCANLISSLLLEQKRRILAQVKPGGALVLAGILREEFGAVQLAYEAAGLRLVNSRAQREWRSGTFV